MKTLTMAATALILVLGRAQAAPQEGDVAKRLLETWAKAADWLVGQQDSAGAWQMGPPGKTEPTPPSPSARRTGRSRSRAPHSWPGRRTSTAPSARGSPARS